MPLEFYLAFIAATAVLMVIPGPNVALIVANSVAHGTRFGLLTVAATSNAVVVHLALTVLGATAVLAFLAASFDWLRWLGVAYLVWLGIAAWGAPAADLTRIGPMLEHHPIFPQRANISVAAVRAPDHLAVRTWERGAGLTKACGSAACAAAVAAARTRRTGRAVTVTLPGGDLAIDWREKDDHILMTGPVEYEFAGRFDRALFAALGAA